MREPVFDYRAFDTGQVPELEGRGWVRCTAEETSANWAMRLGETFEAAGLVGMKKERKR